MKNAPVEQTIQLRGDGDKSWFEITPFYNGSMQAPISFETFKVKPNSNWQYPYAVINEHKQEIWLTGTNFAKLCEYLATAALRIEKETTLDS